MTAAIGYFSFTGTLTRVKTSEDGKMINLIFPCSKFNWDLNKEVEDSLSIMVVKEHMEFAGEYRSMVGKIVTVPCKPLISKAGKIFYMTANDGRIQSD